MDSSETLRPSHYVARHDAGAVLDLLTKALQNREASALEDERPVEERVLVTTWGRWP